MPRPTHALLICMAATVPAAAQHRDHPHHASPYAGQEKSGIAALSADEAQQLRDGAGMGLARAAELNHHPGPRHVLELAAELGLDAARTATVETIHREMRAEAVRLGTEILRAEELLDRRFAHRHLDEAALRAATAEIARLQGELRFTHLRAHLRTAALLTGEQIARYDALRGYR